MLYIVLSVLASTGILVLFRLLDRYGAETSHTILVNYAVSALASLIIFSVELKTLISLWSIPAAIEGIAFYGVFHLMAKSANSSGIAFTSIASKMSVVIPITIGLTFLGETKNLLVYTGIVFGLAAVLMSAEQAEIPNSWKWPLLVFIGSGLIDASFKLYQVWGLNEEQYPSFIAVIFLFAFVASLCHQILKKATKVNASSLAMGSALGLLNLGTVYFLMSALAIPSFDSTLVYASNSFGIVLSSTVVGIIAFKEKINKKGYIGILLAVLSIAALQLAY